MDRPERRRPPGPADWKEIEAQGKDLPPGGRVPSNTIIVRSFDDWVLYFSVTERAFYIKTLDYHPDPLRLPVKAVYEMLADIEKIVAGEVP